MIEIQSDLFQMAVGSDATVLVLGATGTGKTTLARKIHDAGSRRGKPFITINLAATHEGTLESELFGHERGAFTGAESKRVGKLELADGGTVFLDEVGELPIRLQARLLEFLHSKRITPVGGNREVVLNVRVIVATHRDLDLAVTQGTFRADLLHRLRVLTFQLPSLWERKEDFDGLLHELLAEFCLKNHRNILRISEAVASALENYSWPGNFRELKNVVEYMVLSCRGSEIKLGDLPDWLTRALAERVYSVTAPELGVVNIPLSMNYNRCLEDFEKEYLRRALSRFRGRVNHTARNIQINKTTLIRRIRAYGLMQSCGIES